MSIIGYTKSLIDKNWVHFLNPAEYVGSMPVRQDITVLPGDSQRELRLGWIITEEIGMIAVAISPTSIIEMSSKYYDKE